MATILKKTLNRRDSTVRRIAMKYGVLTHFDPPKHNDGQNVEF